MDDISIIAQYNHIMIQSNEKEMLPEPLPEIYILVKKKNRKACMGLRKTGEF